MISFYQDMNSNRPVRLAFPLICILWIAIGCTSTRPERAVEDFTIPTTYRPQNIFSVERMSADINRVALLPIHHANAARGDEDTIAAVVASELRRSGRFEVVVISHDELNRLLGVDALSIQERLPAPLLAYLQEHHGVNGLMQMDITEWRPYRPMVIGLKARLLDLDNREVIWAADERFDAGEARLTRALRSYSLHHLRQEFPARDTEAVLRTPARFLGFASHSLFNTLPPIEVFR